MVWRASASVTERWETLLSPRPLGSFGRLFSSKRKLQNFNERKDRQSRLVQALLKWPFDHNRMMQLDPKKMTPSEVKSHILGTYDMFYRVNPQYPDYVNPERVFAAFYSHPATAKQAWELARKTSRVKV